MKKIILIFAALLISLSAQSQSYNIVVTQPANNDTLLTDLLGVISGPLPPPSSPLPDISPQLQDIGVTSIRNNDNRNDNLDMEALFRCYNDPCVPHPQTEVPSWCGDPHDSGNFHYEASDVLFRAYVDGGFHSFFRLGGESQSALPDQLHVFAGPQDTLSENNWIEATVPVVQHYDNFEGTTGRLDYLDVWTEWPNGVFWERSDPEFIWFFTKALDSLKHHFPGKKVGGPGFLVPTVFVIEGNVNNKATDLLTSLYQHNVKPDFISWHLWNLDPLNYYKAGENYRKLLDGTGAFQTVPWAGTGFFDGVEIICGAWGTPKLNVPDWNVYLLYNKQKGAALLTADWIAMQETNTVRAYYYRCADAPSSDPDTTVGPMGTSGLFYGNAAVTYKPKAYAFKLWSRIYNEFPKKLSCDFPLQAPDSSKLWALPAKNDSDAFAILVSNTDSTDKTFTVDLSAVSTMPLDTNNFDIYYYIVNDNENGNTAHQNYSAGFAIAPQTVMLIRILPKDYVHISSNHNTGTVKLFPNPATGRFTLQNVKDYQIRLTDISGKTVYMKRNNNCNRVTVDISDFSGGVYFLKLYNTHKNIFETKKVVVY